MTKIQQIRKKKYDHSQNDTSLLPPSSRSSYYFPPVSTNEGMEKLEQQRPGGNTMGLEVRNDSLIPGMTDEPDSGDPSKIVRFSCNERCNKSCSCRNADLNCTSPCKECHDMFVTIQERLTNVASTIVILETFDIRYF